MIAIIDYGLGNLGSIYNLIKKIGCDVEVTNDLGNIYKADKLILPGVGNFDAGIRNIREMGLEEILSQKVLIEKCPILGICLGMQLFMENSEEGNQKGLGWIDGDVIKFNFEKQSNYKIPHMGWNTVAVKKKTLLENNFEQEMRFYFVHSYYAKPIKEENIMLTTQYGIEFASGVCKDNIFGVQFHPEKSHRFGKQLLENFVRI